MNWKAQTLPIIMGGLPSRSRADASYSEAMSALPKVDKVGVTEWNALPQPSADEIRRCSPLAKIMEGKYSTPTFLVHGTADDLIPWQQSARTADAMKAQGIDSQLVLVPDGPHVCDGSHDPTSAGWLAVLEAYRWLDNRLNANIRVLR